MRGRSDRKTSPGRLQQQISVYALAAGTAGVSLLALVPPSEAEVIYTAVHQEINRDGTIQVDFNHDGQIDFLIRESVTHQLDFPWNVLNAVPAHGGGIEMGIGVGVAADLRGGAKIGPGKIFFPKTAGMMGASIGGGYYGGSWAPRSTDRYLGVKFLIDGQIHYGWARVSAAMTFRYGQILALLTGYAYETEPGRPIQAGDEGPASIGQATSGSISESFAAQPAKAHPAATLGALALGAQGLSIWRREQSPGF
jgi:hypothetical protein